MPRIGGACIALFASALALAAWTAAPGGAVELPPGDLLVKGVADYDVSCSSAGAVPQTVHFTIAAVGPSVAVIGAPLRLSDLVWSVQLPGTAYAAARSLGLVKPGDVLSATLRPSLVADRTNEGTVALPPARVRFSPVSLDAGGQPRPISGSVALADATWTASGGSAEYRVGPSTVDLDVGPSVTTSLRCASVPTHPIVTTAVVRLAPPGISAEVVRQDISVPLLEKAPATTLPATPPTTAAPASPAPPATEPEAHVAGEQTARPATPAAPQASGGTTGGGGPMARTGPLHTGWLAALGLVLVDTGLLLTAADRKRRTSPRSSRSPRRRPPA